MYEKSIRAIAGNLELQKTSILVTGATGLIGSCLIDVLTTANKNFDAGIRIYALSRSKEKTEHLFGEDVIPLIQDITDPLSEIIEYDYIVHLASNAGPVLYANQPVETVLTNIIGNKNVLDYCVAHKNTKMILASTFEVYGEVEGAHSYSEDMSGTIDLTVLRNCYPESKRCSEFLVRSYVEEYNIKAVIARLPSVYGPTMQRTDNKAHAQFIRNALNGENIVLKSKGIQRRTYCYVIDAVSALLKILSDGKIGETYNVSNEKSIASIAEVAELCAELAGTKVIYAVPNDIELKGFSRTKDCILNNQKLMKLGWKGRYKLKEGLKETLDCLQMRRDLC